MQEEQQDKVADYLRRVTVELRRSRERVLELEQKHSEPIAIVGMSCRFPGGVTTPEQLWEAVVLGTGPRLPVPRGPRLGPVLAA